MLLRANNQRGDHPPGGETGVDDRNLDIGHLPDVLRPVIALDPSNELTATVWGVTLSSSAAGPSTFNDAVVLRAGHDLGQAERELIGVRWITLLAHAARPKISPSGCAALRNSGRRVLPHTAVINDRGGCDQESWECSATNGNVSSDSPSHPPTGAERQRGPSDRPGPGRDSSQTCGRRRNAVDRRQRNIDQGHTDHPAHVRAGQCPNVVNITAKRSKPVRSIPEGHGPPQPCRPDDLGAMRAPMRPPTPIAATRRPIAALLVVPGSHRTRGHSVAFDEPMTNWGQPRRSS